MVEEMTLREKIKGLLLLLAVLAIMFFVVTFTLHLLKLL